MFMERGVQRWRRRLRDQGKGETEGGGGKGAVERGRREELRKREGGEKECRKDESRERGWRSKVQHQAAQ